MTEQTTHMKLPMHNEELRQRNRLGTVDRTMAGSNQFYLREISPFIPMQLQIINMCSIRIWTHPS